MTDLDHHENLWSAFVILRIDVPTNLFRTPECPIYRPFAGLHLQNSLKINVGSHAVWVIFDD